MKITTTVRTLSLVLASSLSVLVSAQEPIQKETGSTKEVHSDESQSFKLKTNKEAFEIDNWLIAEKYGWGIEETRQHMNNQNKFGEFISELERKHSDVFASSAMASRPGESATIWIKGEVKPEIKEKVGKLIKGGKMHVRIVDKARFSVLEQEKRMDKISEVMEKQGIKGVGSAMLPGDIILVSVPVSNSFSETPIPENPEKFRLDGKYIDPVAEDFLPKDMDARGIYFTFTKGPVDIDEHARGGRKVYSATHQCTSGFSVERISDSVTGIATAAHCTGMSNFDAEIPEADFSLFHKGEHCGVHGDVEWKTSFHFELAEYWAGLGDKRNVNSSETSYSVNNTYCVYSRMTGTRTCDQVYSTSVSQGGTSGACNGVTAKRLVAMDNDNTVGGDSGGPWSFSTKAAGIHKGDKWIWFGTRNTFTKASRLDEALGVRILTK